MVDCFHQTFASSNPCQQQANWDLVLQLQKEALLLTLMLLERVMVKKGMLQEKVMLHEKVMTQVVPQEAVVMHVPVVTQSSTYGTLTS